MLAGNARSSVNMTVKWDGAPVFAGIDPSDGKVLCCKKNQYSMSTLNYIKQMQRLMQMSKGSLTLNLKFALAEFSKLGIKGVIQGDLMFTDDKETQVYRWNKIYNISTKHHCLRCAC